MNLKNKKYNQVIVPILVCIISIIIGIFSKNTFVGMIVLITGILNSYYSSVGNKINLLFFMPINIKGYFEWNKNSNKDVVENRGLGLKKGAITIILSIVTGLLVAYLLQLIPGERLTYLDSFTNVISFIAGILLMLRYNESWILYLVNNVLDLTLWIINFSSGGFDSLMVLLMSVMYLVINIYALFKWRDKNERL